MSTRKLTAEEIVALHTSNKALQNTALGDLMNEIIDILNAGLPGDEKVFVSATDATAEYLQNKLVAGSNVTITKIIGGGGVETLSIASSGGGGGGGAGFGAPIDGGLYAPYDAPLIIVPYDITTVSLRVAVKTAPTGAGVILQLLYHATDPTLVAPVGSATVAAGTNVKVQALAVSLAKGGFLVPRITQVGSTIPGSDLAWAVTL